MFAVISLCGAAQVLVEWSRLCPLTGAQVLLTTRTGMKSLISLTGPTTPQPGPLFAHLLVLTAVCFKYCVCLHRVMSFVFLGRISLSLFIHCFRLLTHFNLHPAPL